MTNRSSELNARTGIAEAEQLRLAGELDRAKHIAIDVLRQFPSYYAAHHTLGLINADLKLSDDAILSLSKANALLPNQPITLVALSTVYSQLGAVASARMFTELALKQDPSQAATHLMLGTILKDERDYAKAQAALQTCLRIDPGWQAPKLQLAIVMTHIGQLEQSRDLILDVLDGDPTSGNAAALLLSLPKGLVPLDILQKISDTGFRFDNEAEFPERRHFFTANLMKRLGQHDDAWAAYQKANKTVFTQSATQLNMQQNWQNQSLAHAKKYSDHRPLDDAESPISLFILGPSRSGKTSLEAFIGKSEQVQLGYENPSFKTALHETFSAAGFVSSYQLDLLPEPLHADFRRRYMQHVKARLDGKQIFTDTSPLNIHNALAISRIIPNSRFVFIKRDPIETAIRIFQTNYNSGNLYAYSEKSALKHVKWYYEMIQSCAKILGSHATVVHHEAFCADPGAYVKQINTLLKTQFQVGKQSPWATDSDETQIYRQKFAALIP